MLRLITALVILLTSLAAQAQAQTYVQDRDLISLHYDHAPDKDDGHATVAALAVVRARGIDPHVVSGAYGSNNSNQYQPAAEAVMRQTWGTSWLNAHANWQSAVNATATRWRNTLLNGGDIWIAEGGQSDFTSDVVRSISNSNPGINTRSRIHVVQHSTWNEQQSNSNDLNYSQSNTDYIKIADGNGVNATADLNQKSDNFVQLARASQFGAAWNAAFSYLNPNNKLDFSDTVELLYILGIGKDVIATVDDFGAVFLDQAPTTEPSSPTAWSDSYSVNGQCYCDTNFDHGLSSVSLDTPAGRKSVPEICADITSKFGAGDFNNRVYYNTIQCGHGPANNAADEAICPGIPRGTNDYTGSRCQQTGATWNLDSVYPQPEPITEPVAVTPPEPAVQTETVTPADPQQTTELPIFPVCSANVIDFNGDGYEWENNQTCVVSTTPATPQVTQEAVAPIDNPLINFPVCSATIVDENGDGYGWENNQTCVISANAGTFVPVQTQQPVAPIDNPLVFFPTCSASIIDENSDGYGWENNQTCVIPANTGTVTPVQTQQAVAPIDNPLVFFPTCSANTIDENGDGYGWDNFQTCVIATNTVISTPEPTQQTVAPINNPLVFFPTCSANTIDENGDGYGWDNFQTCVIATSSVTTSTATIQQTVAPIDNPLVFFPICSANTIDENGDGYGWDNFQTCVINSNTPTPTTSPTVDQASTTVTLLNFPICSANAVDPEGDGYAWENNQTCAIESVNPTAAVTFPICSASLVDDNNDGFGWENNQTCSFVAN